MLWNRVRQCCPHETELLCFTSFGRGRCSHFLVAFVCRQRLRTTPRFRYGACLSGYATMVTCVVTGWQCPNGLPPSERHGGPTNTHGISVDENGTMLRPPGESTQHSGWRQHIVGVWVTGVACFSVTLRLGASMLMHVRRMGHAIPVNLQCVARQLAEVLELVLGHIRR